MLSSTDAGRSNGFDIDIDPDPGLGDEDEDDDEDPFESFDEEDIRNESNQHVSHRLRKGESVHLSFRQKTVGFFDD